MSDNPRALSFARSPGHNRFDRLEWAGAFGDLGTLVPFVERVAHLTPIPGRAQFYYSVMWLMWPVAVVNIIRRTSSAGYDRWLNLFISYGPIKSLCINGILLPAAILIIYSPPISDYPDRWDRGISGSVLGLAFGGSMVMDSVVLFSVSICMWIACIPKIYLNNRGLS